MFGLLVRSMQTSKRYGRARFNHKAMLSAYYAHVRAIIEYGCIVWAGAAITHLKRLERVQHRFLLWLARTSDSPTDEQDYRVLLSHYGMPSVKSRFAQYDLMFYTTYTTRRSTVLNCSECLVSLYRAVRLVLWHCGTFPVVE